MEEIKPKGESLLITNAKIFTDSNVMEGWILSEHGVITQISSGPPPVGDWPVLDAEGLLVLPGGVDTHMHIRDPGHSERETFFSGTQCAAVGGTTTIFEHPISVPPQYSPEILHNRQRVAFDQAVVDYAFLGAAGADHLECIDPMSKEGIVAFKTFLDAAQKGREKEFEGLTMCSDEAVIQGFEELAKTGMICFVHAENSKIIAWCTQKLKEAGRHDPIAHALARPPISEIECVSRLIYYAELTGARIQFAHISTPEAMELIRQAKGKGLPVYAETCPHYLFLTEHDLERCGAFAKCNPPLRSPGMVERLWGYVVDGTVDVIGSDHAPFLLAEKEKGANNIFDAPSGFLGAELRYPLLLDAVNQGRLTLERAVELAGKKAAEIYGLVGKGSIQVGNDADFAIVDMHNCMRVRPEDSPSLSWKINRVYEGRELSCRIKYTIVRGRLVACNGKADAGAKGWGRLQKRQERGVEK